MKRTTRLVVTLSILGFVIIPNVRAYVDEEETIPPNIVNRETSVAIALTNERVGERQTTPVGNQESEEPKTTQASREEVSQPPMIPTGNRLGDQSEANHPGNEPTGQPETTHQVNETTGQPETNHLGNEPTGRPQTNYLHLSTRRIVNGEVYFTWPATAVLTITLRRCNISLSASHLWLPSEKLKIILTSPDSTMCPVNDTMPEIRCQYATMDSVGQDRRRRRAAAAAEEFGDLKIKAFDGDYGDLIFKLFTPSQKYEKLVDRLKKRIPEIARQFSIPENKIMIHPSRYDGKEAEWKSYCGLILMVIIIICATIVVRMSCYGCMNWRSRPPPQYELLLVMKEGNRGPLNASIPTRDEKTVRDKGRNPVLKTKTQTVTSNVGRQNISAAKSLVENTKL